MQKFSEGERRKISSVSKEREQVKEDKILQLYIEKRKYQNKAALKINQYLSTSFITYQVTLYCYFNN